ncbi:hypothetical protein RM190_18585 [Paracoccus sp. CPCC 101403]|uniref:Peptidase S8/S53 domain-containing protein n=1 Tax=Paracoccus broussonetiae TaxID=3075834 RepID=A0ABU3EKC5_9RHOB|nr:hypothetical protein [Paracoccus sp. CPCC 101403]MDT1063875.1 hypothetical protein [Paracoccus sp. CPCC 101403]
MIAQETFFSDPELLRDLWQKLPRMTPQDRTCSTQMHRSHDLLSPQALPKDPDSAVIVAVIDHAIPFAHRLLTVGPGHYSRAASTWVMDAPQVLPREDIPFGQEYRGAELDVLRGAGGPHPLDDDAIYRKLCLLDPARPTRWLMRAASHGAGVAGTAGGHDPLDPKGRARPLLAVGLPDWALADTTGAAMPMLMQAAVIFIISRARMLARQISHAAGQQIRPPLVVNISLGLTAGSRDGHSLIERMQDALSDGPVPELGQVHFVLASGNSRQQQLHAVLTPGQQIGWQLLPDDRTPSELQVWSAPLPVGSAAIGLGVAMPGRGIVRTTFTAPQGPGTQVARLRDGQGRELARLTLQAMERGQKLRQCLSLIAPATVTEEAGKVVAPPGTWRIELLPMSPGPCELVIERDDRLIGFPRAGRQSRLIERGYSPRDASGQWKGRDPDPPEFMIRRDGTLNSYAWGGWQIRCGGVFAGDLGDPGYGSLLGGGEAGDAVTPSDRGPALAGMTVPGNRGIAMQEMGGTSIAAPRLTRWLADRMAMADPPRTRAEVIAAIRAAARTARPVPYLDPRLPWERRDS